MKNSLRHIGIVTKNINSSIEFYEKFFNFEIVIDQLEKGTFIEKVLGVKDLQVRTVKLKNENFMIEFLDFGPYTDSSKISLFSMGCSHIAINVKQLQYLHKRLLQNNVEFISEPLLSNDKSVLVCFMKDPNNDFYIELVEKINR